MFGKIYAPFWLVFSLWRSFRRSVFILSKVHPATLLLMSHDLVVFVKIYSKSTHIDFFPPLCCCLVPSYAPCLPPSLTFNKYFFDFELTFCHSCRIHTCLPLSSQAEIWQLSWVALVTSSDNYSVLGFSLLARRSSVTISSQSGALGRLEAMVVRGFTCLQSCVLRLQLFHASPSLRSLSPSTKPTEHLIGYIDSWVNMGWTCPLKSLSSPSWRGELSVLIFISTSVLYLNIHTNYMR